MSEKIMIEFTIEEITDVLLDYYGEDEDTFDIGDFDDFQIKEALLNHI